MINTPAQVAAEFRRRVTPTPTDEALAEVREYMRRRHMIAIDKHTLGFALSAIETGLHSIERGRIEKGAAAIQDGVEFIRSKIEEARRD